jgi:hypothetical protein
MNKQNYRDILNITKKAIGTQNFFNLEVAMYVDMYLGNRPCSNDEFDRICRYIKSIYVKCETYELFNTVYHVISFLKNNSIDQLESIKTEEFIQDFIELSEKQCRTYYYA